MFELVELKTGRIIERYDYNFDEFIKTKYGGFFSLIIDDVFTPGKVRPEFAWRRSKTTELVNIPSTTCKIMLFMWIKKGDKNEK